MQSAESSRVLARAHRITALLPALPVAGILAAGAADGDAPRAYMGPVSIAVLVFHWLMPLWVADRTAQNDPTEDEERAVL
ncbi:hypothetical protein AB0H86_17350 [Streptomyces sp. NPDC050997]|uniref:hypothetical protein n=1 Tax=Streptomyces sp. NPDC050997 TaxID=3155519 RepID=UPI0034305FB7